MLSFASISPSTNSVHADIGSVFLRVKVVNTVRFIKSRQQQFPVYNIDLSLFLIIWQYDSDNSIPIYFLRSLAASMISNELPSDMLDYRHHHRLTQRNISAMVRQ